MSTSAKSAHGGRPRVAERTPTFPPMQCATKITLVILVAPLAMDLAPFDSMAAPRPAT